MTWGNDVWHVLRSAMPYIGVLAAWSQGKRSAMLSPRYGWPQRSGTSGTEGIMRRRLGRTPLLRRHGRIKMKRWAR